MNSKEFTMKLEPFMQITVNCFLDRDANPRILMEIKSGKITEDLKYTFAVTLLEGALLELKKQKKS